MRKLLIWTIIALLLSFFDIVPVMAQNNYSQVKYPTKIILNQQVLYTPYSMIKRKTTYLPIWYVIQLLNQLHISNTWNGSTGKWSLTDPNATMMTLPNQTNGNQEIALNGNPVVYVAAFHAKDPLSGKSTTYMPIWYIMQILTHLGLQNTWNGALHTWSITDEIPSTIQVTPSTLTPLTANGQSTEQVTALIKDNNGNPIHGQTVTFNSSDSGVATITPSATTDENGVATAIITAGTQAGQTTIAIGAGSVSQSMMMETVAGPPSAITVSPLNPLPADGFSTEAITATVKDSYGNPVNGVGIQFKSSNPAMANLTSSAITNDQGVATAYITSGLSTGSGSIEVSGSGFTSQSVPFTTTTASINTTDSIKWTACIPAVAGTFIYSPSNQLYVFNESGIYTADQGQYQLVQGSDNIGQINRLAWSPSGTLYAGTSNQGLWKYQNGVWSQLVANLPYMSTTAITQISWSPDGYLTVACVWGMTNQGLNGIYQYQNGNWVELGASGNIADSGANSFAWSQDGTLYAGSTNNGVYEFINNAWVSVGGTNSLLTNNSIDCIGLSPDGVLTVGTTGASLSFNNTTHAAPTGVYQYINGSWTQLGGSASTFDNQDPMSLVEGFVWLPDGSLLASIEDLGHNTSGLWDYSNGQWTPVNQNVFKQASVGPIYINNNQIEISTNSDMWSAPVNNISQWQPAFPTPTLTNNIVNTFAISPSGALAIGTETTGVWEKQNGQWNQVGGPNSPLSQSYINSISWSPSGALVANAYNQLWVYTGNNWVALPNPTGATISTFMYSPSGTLYASANINGGGIEIEMYSSNAWTTIYTTQPSEVITGMALSPNGFPTIITNNTIMTYNGSAWNSLNSQPPAINGFTNINWLGYSPSGVLTVINDNVVFQYINDQWIQLGNSFDIINTISWTPSGTILVGGNEGLWEWANGKWILISSHEPVSMQIAPNGEIYILNMGLALEHNELIN